MSTVTVHQPTEALRVANKIRVQRADVKASLRTGELRFWDAIEDPAVAGMRVADLLRAVPDWGRVKVEATLRRAEIGPFRTVGATTDRQWRLLAEHAGTPGERL